MSITVIIPTRRRPEYLKTTLESIKRQTAVQSIDKIIVSENSEDDRSKLICEAFPSLNIKYIQQTPELSGIDHFTWIINQSSSDYTAMLHDDDWWYPTHLENAIAVLKREDVACYFSNFVFTENEIYKKAFFHYSSVFSYFTADTGAFDFPGFDLPVIASICYLFTPFHMSAMVAKTTSLQAATMQSLALAKPFYADRILYPYLALYGKMVLNPQILCGIRMHAQNDVHSIEQQQKVCDHREGSAKIIKLALERNIDIFSIWEKVKQDIGSSEWTAFQNIYTLYLGEFAEAGSPFYVAHSDQKEMKHSNSSATVLKGIKYLMRKFKRKIGQ